MSEQEISEMFDRALPEDAALSWQEQATETSAQLGRALQLIQDGLHCDFDDKAVPLTIDDDSDPSVGLHGKPYLSLPDGYELVPSSFLRGIKRTMGEDLYEKSLDVWRQINDPNYGGPDR